MNNELFGEKFSTLYETIPKYPEIWNTDDINKWLEIIGMEKYSQNFIDMKVDGYLILDLEESDIEEELQIPVRLHRKKIMKGIQLLKEYTTYLRHHKRRFNESGKNNKNRILNEEQFEVDG